MRVIGGEAHGRKLRAPRGGATRPTLARVRQSIFSRLAARIDLNGRRVLDLYAGAGGLGIEALSRGASSAIFVDNSRAAVNAVERNLVELKLSGRARVICGDVAGVLARLAAANERFDLVFADPPYGSGIGDQVLKALLQGSLIARGGWIVVELGARESAPQTDGLERLNVATMGDHQLALYWRPEGAPESSL